MANDTNYRPELMPGDAAPNGQALLPTGDHVELSSLWSSGPTLLTFLRHFG